MAWEAGLRASGLPLSMSEAATPRPRIMFAAPAPVGVLAERELIDIVLTELILIHDVRAAVEAGAPPGYRSVDLYDVWLAGPSVASLVTAGDYRVTVMPEVSSARASAERPRPSNRLISPNRSPRSMSANMDSRPSRNLLEMAMRPEVTT